MLMITLNIENEESIFIQWYECYSFYLMPVLSEKRVLPSMVLASFAVYFVVAAIFYFDVWSLTYDCHLKSCICAADFTPLPFLCYFKLIKFLVSGFLNECSRSSRVHILDRQTDNVTFGSVWGQLNTIKETYIYFRFTLLLCFSFFSSPRLIWRKFWGQNRSFQFHWLLKNQWRDPWCLQ